MRRAYKVPPPAPSRALPRPPAPSAAASSHDCGLNRANWFLNSFYTEYVPLQNSTLNSVRFGVCAPLFPNNRLINITRRNHRLVETAMKLCAARCIDTRSFQMAPHSGGWWGTMESDVTFCANPAQSPRTGNGEERKRLDSFLSD
ncbi:unnamed protein product, partial [Iphiclides podalirius]